MCIIRLPPPASHKQSPSCKKAPWSCLFCILLAGLPSKEGTAPISMTGGFSSILLIVSGRLLSRSVFDAVEDLVAFHIKLPCNLFIQ